MTPEEIEIARGFVACGRWRWMPGMMSEGWRLTCVSLHDGAWSATSTLAHRKYHYPTLPNINDPATLGCILRLVRDAWRRPKAYLQYVGVYWCVVDPRDNLWLDPGIGWKTEAEALLRALQSAPEAS